MTETNEFHAGSICSPHFLSSDLDASYSNNVSLQLDNNSDFGPILPFVVDSPPPPSAFSPGSAAATPPLPPTLSAPTKRRHPRGSGSHPTPGEKAVRAEKNRRFARESRERKRRHLRSVEAEVVSLRAELSQYKERFSRYELIEQQRVLSATHKHGLISSTFEEIARTGADLSQFSRIMVQKTQQIMEERRKALSQLFGLVLQLAVPMSLRLCFWAAENNLDTLSPQSICKRMGYGLSEEKMQTLTECLNALRRGSPEEERKHMERTATISRNIREHVKRMVECQRGTEREIMKMCKGWKAIFMSKYTPELAEKELMFAPKLSGRPELTDQAVFHMSDQDLSLDTEAAELSGEGEMGADK